MLEAGSLKVCHLSAPSGCFDEANITGCMEYVYGILRIATMTYTHFYGFRSRGIRTPPTGATHMANELNWLRDKAKLTQTDTLIISADEATAAECQPGTYRVDYFAFEGTVPFRMARVLSGSKLVNTESENEVLRLGNGYRGGEGQCRYYRTIYTLVGA